MESTKTKNSGYIVAILLGSAAGGLAVLCITNAIPRMMKRMMAGMFESMRTQMGSTGCNPEAM